MVLLIDGVTGSARKNGLEHLSGWNSEGITSEFVMSCVKWFGIGHFLCGLAMVAQLLRDCSDRGRSKCLELRIGIYKATSQERGEVTILQAPQGSGGKTGERDIYKQCMARSKEITRSEKCKEHGQWREKNRPPRAQSGNPDRTAVLGGLLPQLAATTSNPNPGAIFVLEKPPLYKHGPTVPFQRSKVEKEGSLPALEGFSAFDACVSHRG